MDNYEPLTQDAVELAMSTMYGVACMWESPMHVSDLIRRTERKGVSNHDARAALWFLVDDGRLKLNDDRSVQAVRVWNGG